MAKLIILSETTKQMKVKSRPRISHRRLQEFINLWKVLIEAPKLLRRQPGGGFCSKRLYSGRCWNVFSGTAYTITQVEECAFQLAGFILSKASLAAVAAAACLSSPHRPKPPWQLPPLDAAVYVKTFCFRIVGNYPFVAARGCGNCPSAVCAGRMVIIGSAL